MWSRKEQILTIPPHHYQHWSLVSFILVMHTVLVHRGIGRLPATPAPFPGVGPGGHLGSVVSSGTPVGRVTPKFILIVPFNHLLPHFVLLQ